MKLAIVSTGRSTSVQIVVKRQIVRATFDFELTADVLATIVDVATRSTAHDVMHLMQRYGAVVWEVVDEPDEIEQIGAMLRAGLAPVCPDSPAAQGRSPAAFRQWYDEDY